MSVFYLTGLIAWFHREFYVRNYFHSDFSFFFQILKTLLYCFLVHSTVAVSILIPATTPVPSHVCVCVCVCVCVYVFSPLKVCWICWEISQWYHFSADSCVFCFCFFNPLYRKLKGFRGGSVVQNPTASVGDIVLIPGLERSPGEGNGNPFQYSCLGNPMDREAWQATVHGVAKESDTA